MAERYEKSLAWFRGVIGIKPSTGYRWLTSGKVPPECVVQTETGIYKVNEAAVLAGPSSFLAAVSFTERISSR